MKRILLLVLTSFLLANQAHAAVLSVVPSSTSVSSGDLVTVRVLVNTTGSAINNSEGTLQFPTGLLSVVSVSKTSSIFSLWVTEPTFSNAAGTVSWDGGLPTPGFTGSNGSVISVTFLAKASGTATLSLTDAAVRANDGLGTDVLTSSGTAAITIGAAQVAPPTTPANPIPVTPTPSGPGLAQLTLSSKTHPDQNAWYADNDPVVDWVLPGNADAIEVLAADAPGTTPTVTYKASVTEKQVKDLADGTWYFNLRYRAGGVWSAVSSYKLNIDTTPPAVDTHSFVYDEAAHSLSVSAAVADKASGIARYELSIDDGEPKTLSSDAFGGGAYLMPLRDAGTHTATLRVYDRAGNHTDLSERFTVPLSVLDTPVFSFGAFTVTLLGALLLMALISLLSLAAAITAWYLLYTRTGVPAARRRANRETVHKAFGLIRQDLSKHVRALRKARDGKELTKAEGDLGEEMNANLTDLERYLNEHTDLLE